MFVGDCPELDVVRLSRAGALRQAASLDWAGTTSAQTRPIGHPAWGLLVRWEGTALGKVILAIHWRPGRLGGHFPMWACPTCERGVRKLFVTDKIACRTCLGLHYRSQAENPRTFPGLILRARRLTDRLAANEGTRPGRRGRGTAATQRLQERLERTIGQTMQRCRESSPIIRSGLEGS